MVLRAHEQVSVVEDDILLAAQGAQLAVHLVELREEEVHLARGEGEVRVRAR